MAKKENSSPVLWFCIIMLFIIAGGIFVFPVYRKWREKQQELRMEQERLAARRQELLINRKKADDLANSPAAVSRIAREKHNKSRANESVLYYQPDDNEKNHQK